MIISTRRVALGAGILAIIVTAVWYLAFFTPQSHRLKSAHKAYNQTQQQISALESQIAQLRVLEREKPADTARLATLDGAVPTSPQLSTLMRDLHELATNSGVQLTTFNPANSTTSGTAGASAAANSATGPTSMQLSMNSSGSYGQERSFLAGLDAMPRALVVDSVSVSPSSSGNMTVNLNARVFYAAEKG